MKINHTRWKSVTLAATIALLPGSPIWDQNKSFGATIDQRGFARSIDDTAIPNASGVGGNIVAVGMDLGTGPAFVVTTTDDHDDGTCDAGDCTLREAILAANAAVDTNTITFGSNVRGTITLVLGRLSVGHSTNIIGPGARLLAVSGNNVTSVFNFFGTSNNHSSTVSGMTIRDGAAATSANGVAFGSGVFNVSVLELTISDCAFANNAVRAGDSTSDGGTGDHALGGAICNLGTLTINRCTFSGNVATGGRGGDGATTGSAGGNGGDARGAGVFNDTSARLTMNACSFGNNIASGGTGGHGNTAGGNGGNGGKAAGSVFNLGTMTVTGVTCKGNYGFGGTYGLGGTGGNIGSRGVGTGGLMDINGGSTVRDTISAGNGEFKTFPSDAYGAFTSEGYNFIGAGNHSSGFTGPGDHIGTGFDPLNAMLGPLQDNGGATDTFAPSTGSPVIDAGKSFEVATDQRGYLRILDNPGVPNATDGDGSDIGALELGSAPPQALLGNISTRVRVETGDNVLIGGFIITGTQPKKVIVRAIGPSLSMAGALADPVLELHSPGMAAMANDNWRSDQEAEIIATGVAPSSDLESAIVATLPANNSTYTVIVRGVSSGTGIGLVEAYDLDQTVNSKLANISARGLVQTGDDVLIAGTIVVGNTVQRVIVRAIGPSLTLPGNLADPALELRDENGALIRSNDNWRSDQEAEIIATTIPPTNDLEAAIVQDLAPGNYTAIVRGANDATGIALVEAYGLN